MTHLAFYAPLKSPNHAVPSGDRAMARSLMKALADADCTVDLTSELRSLDRIGDHDQQAALRSEAEHEIQRLLNHTAETPWQVWVTYHNYYKAPDLIGPSVSAILGIPYVQIESTRAHKRLHGPWGSFAQAAETASDHADVIFHLTANDRITLLKHKADHQKIVHLPPFLALTSLDPIPERPSDSAKILCAGMMRSGDKFASYQIIAETLTKLRGKNWRLDIAGDGPARSAVEALFAPFSDQVTFLGELGAQAMRDAYDSVDLFFWPGVNEAFGMVFLEAQAAGLPVIAQDRPGVRDVVHGGVLTDPNDPTALAIEIDSLISAPDRRLQLAQIGRDGIQTHHLISAASRTLMAHIKPLIRSMP
jgi:glycosyltransferase involved in cell wall biosynthesis